MSGRRWRNLSHTFAMCTGRAPEDDERRALRRAYWAGSLHTFIAEAEGGPAMEERTPTVGWDWSAPVFFDKLRRITPNMYWPDGRLMMVWPG